MSEATRSTPLPETALQDTQTAPAVVGPEQREDTRLALRDNFIRLFGDQVKTFVNNWGPEDFQKVNLDHNSATFEFELGGDVPELLRGSRVILSSDGDVGMQKIDSTSAYEGPMFIASQTSGTNFREEKLNEYSGDGRSRHIPLGWSEEYAQKQGYAPLTDADTQLLISTLSQVQPMFDQNGRFTHLPTGILEQ